MPRLLVPPTDRVCAPYSVRCCMQLSFTTHACISLSVTMGVSLTPLTQLVLTVSIPLTLTVAMPLTVSIPLDVPVRICVSVALTAHACLRFELVTLLCARILLWLWFEPAMQVCAYTVSALSFLGTVQCRLEAGQLHY